LSSNHASRREAELVTAVWRALPMPWEYKTISALERKQLDLPIQLRRWIAAIREKKG